MRFFCFSLFFFFFCFVDDGIFISFTSVCVYIYICVCEKILGIFLTRENVSSFGSAICVLLFFFLSLPFHAFFFSLGFHDTREYSKNELERLCVFYTDKLQRNSMLKFHCQAIVRVSLVRKRSAQRIRPPNRGEERIFFLLSEHCVSLFKGFVPSP